MPLAAIDAYLARLPKVQAEYSLIFSDVVNLPWLDKEHRTQVHERWQMAINNGAAASAAAPQLAALKLIGIGVEFVR